MNFGLIGKHISHSFSKPYFEKKFLTQDRKGYTYTNFDLENLDTLPEIIRTHKLQGLNVTKPYKESVIPYLTNLDPVAAEIGAVNCIKISQQGQLVAGYNTDHYGFGQSIKPFLEPVHERALILGTGGASKAVAYALKKIGVEVYFVSRGTEQKPGHFNYDQLNEYILRSFKLIVNCTPLGLFPASEQFPDIPYQFIGSQHLLYDLIYNPEETLFLKKGKEQGAVTINGLSMLKLQADKAWEIWTQ